ncbi:MAG: bifunctional oligoribonuclease and phosphatase NrnA [Candidatus Dependentiae bacterium]|nr:bifunctional oligoribonuclease and phosphatase NrnA [Candidatus Dependentiae bacterium]
MNKSQLMWPLIEAAHRITLLAHQKPDPDALGSTGALALLFKRMGKIVEVIYPGIGRDPLPYVVEHLQENTHTMLPDLIISCDTPTMNRLYFPAEFTVIPHINIDHHQHNTIPATVSYVDTTCTSTCEMVYRLLVAWQQPLSADMASMLLFGIMTDTLNFKVPGTTPSTLRVAADLIECGANLAALNQALIIHSDPKVLALWGELLHTARHNKNESVMWTVCSPELLAKYQFSDTALNGFVAFFAQTLTNDVSILFYENNGMSKASMRSKATNVNAIAREFGGGGHILASGITSSLPLEELIKEVTAKFLP